MVGNDGLLGDVGVSLGTDAGRRGQAEWKEGRDHENRGSWAGGSQRAVWEVIRINYSRSITRAIKVRAKRLLITKEANLSVSLAHPSRPFRIPVSQCPRPSLFSTDDAVSAETAVYSARTKFHSEFCFLNVCALRLYLSLPLAASRAPFLPRIVEPLEMVVRGERERRGRKEGWISRASCP